MKTKTFSHNRVTRSHSTASNDMAMPCNRVTAPVAGSSAVSKRDSETILRQARQIRETWTSAERSERAEMGAQRRAELCELLFGATLA